MPIRHYLPYEMLLKISSFCCGIILQEELVGAGSWGILESSWDQLEVNSWKNEDFGRVTRWKIFTFVIIIGLFTSAPPAILNPHGRPPSIVIFWINVVNFTFSNSPTLNRNRQEYDVTLTSTYPALSDFTKFIIKGRTGRWLFWLWWCAEDKLLCKLEHFLISNKNTTKNMKN